MGRAARTGGAEDPAGVFAGSGAIVQEFCNDLTQNFPHNTLAFRQLHKQPCGRYPTKRWVSDTYKYLYLIIFQHFNYTTLYRVAAKSHICSHHRWQKRSPAIRCGLRKLSPRACSARLVPYGLLYIIEHRHLTSSVCSPWGAHTIYK